MLYKKRLAMLLAVILTITGVMPVSAAEPVDVPVSANEAAAGESTEITPETASSEDAPAPEDAAEEVPSENGTAPEDVTVSGDEAAPEDGTVSENEAGGDDGSVSENVSGDSVSPDSISEDNAGSAEDEPADVTIMYYIVGSDLERRNAEATKDIMEIMTGMLWAERSGVNSKVNVIAETGGVSFKADEGESADQKKKAYESMLIELRSRISESEDDVRSYDTIKEAGGISWDKNQRWVISGTSIKPAKNDTGMNRDRVMSHYKSTGGDTGANVPELEDFIETTAKEYPAKNYMLVLWDHGGGPADGYAGDERADSKDNGYITSEQLSKSLSAASLAIRRSGQDEEGNTRESGAVSVNAGFEKYAFLGFDACLMGNLETAMAVTPYADYLFGSEDLESGTGWDHRGYVKEMLEASPDEYKKANIGETTKKIGKQMAEDTMVWYELRDDTDTISIISLNELQLKDLDHKIGELAYEIRQKMLADDNGSFKSANYAKFLEALQRSIHFNGEESGIVDLYSLCEEVKRIAGVDGNVRNAANAVQNVLKDGGTGSFSYYDQNGTNPGPVIYESYNTKYPFAKNDDPRCNKEKLGGITVYFPHDGFRIKLDDGTFADSFKYYLDIYYNGIGSGNIETDNKLGDGYKSLLETFCSIQVIGSAMEEAFDKDDEAAQKGMKSAFESIKGDYKLSENSIAKKTGQNMTENEGLVKGRISANDLNMKTIISDNNVLYVYDVPSAKKEMINRITSQMTFTDESGKTRRLGYLPDMSGSEALTDGSYRFIPQNRDKAEWFYMGDVPASIYSVKNLTTDGDPAFFNALDDNTPVLVQLATIIRRPLYDEGNIKNGKFSDEIAILEAEVGTNSQNVVPRGYYQLDLEQKQLFGFITWSDVSDEAEFWAMSDLGEYIANDVSDFKEDDYSTYYGESMKKGSVSINRQKRVEYDGVRINYFMRDVFGGKYSLDPLYDGESARVSLSINRTGQSDTDCIYEMQQGEDGVHPVYRYETESKEYSLKLSKDLPIGYYDTAGAFHDLNSPDDFKALTPGTYDIVFKYFDSEKNVIIPEEGTTVSVDGVPGSFDPARYSFYTNDTPLTLTVYDKEKPLSIEKKADMPYGFVKTMIPVDDMMNFVTVRNGGGDVTRSNNTEFTVSVNGQKYNLSQEDKLNAFRALDLVPGTKMTVSADFWVGDDYIHCPASVELTVVKQPVKMYGVNKLSSYEYINDNVFWDCSYTGGEYEYRPEVKILMQYKDKVYDDRPFGNYVGKTVNIGNLISENTVSTAIIDTAYLDGAAIYNDIPFGPKLEGKKRPGYWKSGDFVADFAKYYTIENYGDTVLNEYELLPASKVTFRSLKGTDDDEELCPEVYVGCFTDTDNFKDGLWTVSEDHPVISMKGAAVKQWYVRIGDYRRVPVWIDGAPVMYYDYITDKDQQLVVSENGSWRFYIPQAASSNTVCFYAGYEEKSTTFDETTRGEKFNITADYIMPVEYTGKKLVTTYSTKSGVSKMVGLTLRDASGNALKEGTDYTVSYRYNKNAAGPSDAKAPTLLIKGKGDKYRGMKAEVGFTILPADLYYAQVTVDRKFAPFTSKGKLTAKVSVKLPSGVKVPAANYDIIYYDEDDNEIAGDRMKELYKGDEAVPVEIVLRGKNNTKKNSVNNYRAGSNTASLYVTGYPKGSKNLTVKLKNTSQKFEAGKPVKAAELGKTVLRSVKIGSKKVDAADLKDVTAYYDSKLTKPAAENGKLMDRAGTYYLAFEVKDEKKGRTSPDYPAYRAAAVKYTLKGTKIKTGKTKLENTKPEFKGAGNNVSVNILIDKEKLKAEEFYMTYTTRDCSKGGGTVGYKKNAVNGVTYDFYIDDNGKLFTDAIDNGAKGTYKITLEARGAYTGKFTLSYKVK